MLRKVEELERRRRALAASIDESDAERRAAQALREITETQVKAILLERRQALADANAVKATLRALVGRVEIDPTNLRLTVHYRIAVPDRLSMASPRGFAGLPVLTASRSIAA